MPINEREGAVHKQPKTIEERTEIAKECCAKLKIAIPTLIDGMDNAANNAYAAWPDRLYVVGKDGKVAYKGAQGPGGFKPQEMEQALAKLLRE